MSGTRICALCDRRDRRTLAAQAVIDARPRGRWSPQPAARWRYLRARVVPASCVRSSPDGSVFPTKWTDSLPATAFGVMTQVPPQEARATFPAVFESAMYVNPLPIAPRIQKLAFTGAY